MKECGVSLVHGADEFPRAGVAGGTESGRPQFPEFHPVSKANPNKDETPFIKLYEHEATSRNQKPDHSGALSFNAEPDQV